MRALIFAASFVAANLIAAAHAQTVPRQPPVHAPKKPAIVRVAATQAPLPQPRPAAAPAAPAPAAAVAVNPFQSLLDAIKAKVSAINAFTLTDAQAAAAMAGAIDPTSGQMVDKVGNMCWAAIAAKLQSGAGGTILPSGLGLAQLIESARLIKIEATEIQAGTDPVVIACAPLVLDTQNTLLMLAGKGAAAALLVP